MTEQKISSVLRENPIGWVVSPNLPHYPLILSHEVFMPDTKKYTLPEAIARMEGFYVKDSRASRNNNPGNINYGNFAKANGAIGIELGNKPRYAVFPTPEVGFDALKKLLAVNYSGMTVEKAILKYAPPSENDSQNYINTICAWMQCTPDTLVNDVLGS